MSEPMRILVTGAGGFIGHHLVTYLKKQGYWVRGVDVKYPEYTRTDADEFALLDLRHWDHAQRVTAGIDEAYLLAADMGGIRTTHACARSCSGNPRSRWKTAYTARIAGSKSRSVANCVQNTPNVPRRAA